MNKILTDRINELKRLCELYNVKTMYAFGYVCTDKFNNDSDMARSPSLVSLISNF